MNNFFWRGYESNKFISLSGIRLGCCCMNWTNWSLCNVYNETSSHLFLHCPFLSSVWSKILGWLYYSKFVCVFRLLERRSRTKGVWLIWHATIWVIWKGINNRIFKNISKAIDEIVEEIKVLSWRWSLTRLKCPPCFYYEWCWDPGDCVSR